MAYNLETVLSEKLETIIARDLTNTRMRDFYDIYILQQIYGGDLSKEVFCEALYATALHRGTYNRLTEAAEVLLDIEQSSVMKKLLENYQNKFSYATDISWAEIMTAVNRLADIIK